jgi:ribosomal protein S5
LGSDNILNVVQATFAALQDLQDFRQESVYRGVEPRHLAPFWYREEIHG